MSPARGGRGWREYGELLLRPDALGVALSQDTEPLGVRPALLREPNQALCVLLRVCKACVRLIDHCTLRVHHVP